MGSGSQLLKSMSFIYMIPQAQRQLRWAQLHTQTLEESTTHYEEAWGEASHAATQWETELHLMQQNAEVLSHASTE